MMVPSPKISRVLQSCHAPGEEETWFRPSLAREVGKVIILSRPLFSWLPRKEVDGEFV